MRKLGVCVQPDPDPALVEAVTRAGAELVPLAEAAALVWTSSDPAAFPAQLPDGIGWVQLPSAGIERWFDRKVLDPARLWTSAAGAYAPAVAEHALALLLAGVRALALAARKDSWEREELLSRTGTLRGSRVTIVGAGGIGRALIPMLGSLGADVLAVNRSGRPVEGATQTVPVSELDRVWPVTDHVVVAAPATPQTRHLIGAAQLAALRPTSWVVNVARGELIDTDALVRALGDGTIGGAALDVTDPEPLPPGHPLWTEPRAIITPHSANPRPLLNKAFVERVGENVARRIDGRELLGRVDVAAGY
jgi:phosphoglycerate dehydrogenase-like enzyme